MRCMCERDRPTTKAFIYLFKINDRRTRGPLQRSEVHRSNKNKTKSNAKQHIVQAENTKGTRTQQENNANTEKNGGWLYREPVTVPAVLASTVPVCYQCWLELLRLSSSSASVSQSTVRNTFCTQGRINHSGGPYQRKAGRGPFSRTRSQDFFICGGALFPPKS